MISFEPTQEQQLVRDVVRDLAKSRLRPASAAIEKDAFEIDAALDAVGKLSLIRSLAEAALTGDELYPRILSTIVLEELAWGDVNTAASFAATTAFVRAVAEAGTDTQKRAVLPAYADNDYAAAAIAAIEPGIPFSLTRMKTTLAPRGGTMVLNGAKTLVPQARSCQHLLVIARHEARMVPVIVSTGAAGVAVGERRETMGLTAQRLCDVTFTNVAVNVGDVLGADQRTETAADVQTLVNGSWTAAAAILAGLCRAVYEHSVEYTKMRHAHGSALARKQVIALRLVDMFIDVEAIRWMSWRAATHIDKNIGGARSPRLAHTFAVKKANWIADEGVQFMGGHGYIRENPVEAWYRNAKTLATMQLTFGV